MHRHVLVVLAHPDDETFGCGGTIALHAKAGTPVTYVCATRGEMGRSMGNPVFATRESMPLLREKELRDACAVLGVGDLRFLGLRDKTVEFVDPDLLAGRIRAIIDEVKPSLVITFYPGYGVHPDHNAIGVATIKAIAGMPKAERPEVHCKAFGHNVEDLGPAQEVDVTSVLDAKLKAFEAHRSQTQVMWGNIEVKMANDPEFRAKVVADRGTEKHWVYQFAD